MPRWWRSKEAPRPPAQTPGDQGFDRLVVLGLLRDGVVLIGSDGTVSWTNVAARRLLDSPDRSVGRPLLEVVRDHRIEALVQRAVAVGTEQLIEVTLALSGRSLRVRAIPFAPHGSFLILEETTRLRHLETVRQQFVANLSHELRTPLAALDLAAQTLAGQLPGEAPSAVFMDRVLQESQRLNAI